MEIKAVINKDAALAALRQFPEQVSKQLRLATKTSLRDIQVGAQQDHKFISRGGMADRSVTPQANGDGLGGQVFLDIGIAPYAPFLHTGTGTFGPRGEPYVIRPKNGKALRFVVGGKVVFARGVKHPGIHGDPFLYRSADREAPRIVERFDKAIDTAASEAGLK